MIKIVIIGFMCCFFLLGACAPSVRGSSSANTFDISTYDPITVTPGNRWYVKDIWAARSFGIDLGGLSGSKFSSSSRSFSSLSGRFRLTEVTTPDEWQVRLVSARGVKEVTSLSRTTYGASAYYQSTVELIFTVEVPPTTSPGSYSLSAVVMADTGKSQTVPIQVIVKLDF